MKVTVVKFIAALALGLFVAPLVAGAQQAGKVYRIGYLNAGSPGPGRPVFEQALRERGWVTGENLVIAYRYAEGKYERLPALATELVRLEPQVIVAVSTAAAQAAKGATKTDLELLPRGQGRPSPRMLPCREGRLAAPSLGFQPFVDGGAAESIALDDLTRGFTFLHAPDRQPPDRLRGLVRQRPAGACR